MSRVAGMVLLILLVAGGGCEQTTRPDSAETATPQSPGPPEDRPTKSQAPVDVIEEHWPNGAIRTRVEVIHDADGEAVYHGTYTRWFDNGQKEYETTYVNGTIHGVERQWHRNGQLHVEQHIQHGVRHGTRISWDADGRQRIREEYCEGKPHGVWTVWTSNGDVKWRQTYDHGVPVP